MPDIFCFATKLSWTVGCVHFTLIPVLDRLLVKNHRLATNDYAAGNCQSTFALTNQNT